MESELANNDVSNDAFLREVDEEYRRSQVAGLWARYGRYVAVGVVVFLAAVGGLLYWREDRARRAGIAGEELTQAIAKVEAGDVKGAAPTLDRLAASPQPGYRALALLTQAAAAARANDVARAVALYTRVSGDQRIAAPFRDLATIKATRLEFDVLAPAATIARLKALAVPGNPWFPIAAEMTAIAHMNAGQPALAAPLFAAIERDPTAAPTLRGRAGQLAVSLGATPPAALQPASSGTAK